MSPTFIEISYRKPGKNWKAFVVKATQASEIIKKLFWQRAEILTRAI